MRDHQSKGLWVLSKGFIIAVIGFILLSIFDFQFIGRLLGYIGIIIVFIGAGIHLSEMLDEVHKKKKEKLKKERREREHLNIANKG